MAMPLYETANDFTGTGIIPVLSAISQATHGRLFYVMLFTVFIFGTASSYFSILKLTGKKRFWHSLAAMSFISFLASLLIAGMNSAEVVFLSGYWVGFYVLMVLLSYYLLDRYK